MCFRWWSGYMQYVITTWTLTGERRLDLPSTQLTKWQRLLNKINLLPKFLWWSGHNKLTTVKIKEYTVTSPSYLFEPPHDKTNKMTVRSAKTQISLGIHPVWSESSLSAQSDQSFRLRSMGSKGPKLSSAQAEPSLRWAHIPFGWFCHEAAHMLSY